MCGIVGYINVDNTYSQPRRNWIEHALFVDQLRGKDSTGLYVRPKKKFVTDDNYPTATYYKRALPASDFLRMAPVTAMLAKADDARVVIGHNRKATQGAKDDDNNAHPFDYPGITMVHNGTLITRRGLKEFHTVDSQSIACHIASIEPDEYTKMLSELDGAFALVWDNRDEEKVYISRNSERPLWGAYGWDKQTLLFASEPWMIDQLMNRAGALDKLDTTKDKQLAMFPFSIDTLYAVDYSGGEVKMTAKQYTPIPSPPKPTPVTTTYSTGGSSWPHNKGKNTNVDLTANKGCPYKKGDLLFASQWEWEKPEGKKTRGTLRGISAMHPNVHFSCGNVTAAANDALLDQWNEWVETALDDLSCEMEILLSGVVSSISAPKGKEKNYVVNLKPKTLQVEGFTEEDFTDDLDEDESEKKYQPETNKGESNLPVAVSNGATYKRGSMYISANEWLAAVSGGCDMCGRHLSLSDHTSVEWIETIVNGSEKELDPICGDCAAQLGEGYTKQ